MNSAIDTFYTRSRRREDDRARFASIWTVVGALLALGCANDFEPPSLVSSPRLLAVIVDPPEALPGDDVTFRPLVASPNDEALTLAFRVDLSTAALAAGAGQAIGEPAEPIALAWDGDAAALGGERTASAIEALFAQLGEVRPGTPEDVVRLVYEQVGLPLTAEVELRDRDGAIVLEGFKRFHLTSRAERTTNPPPPRFAIGGRWVSASPADPLACTPEGEAPQVQPGAVVTLAPDPSDEAWLETYPALDLEGERIERREGAFYSWYATAGAFAFAVTRPPDRDVEWTAPEEPGEYPIWLVVRDGHLGTSACRASVRVAAR